MWAQSAWAAMAVWGLTNCAVFVVGYHRKTDGSWWFYPMGRHLMGFIVSLGLVFVLMIASLALGPLGPGPWVVALVVVNIFLTQRNWLLFTRRWRSRASDASEHSAEHRIRRNS